MIKLSHKEVMHLAALSRIELKEEEIPQLIKDLEEALSYAAGVAKIATEAQEMIEKNSNVFRDDTVIATDPVPLLANVPRREENYVVVPVILEEN